jgi:hypothetical protein
MILEKTVQIPAIIGKVKTLTRSFALSQSIKNKA